mmetsp:Transcript_18516/g.32363  ORF Transcript_18516/g.32363 Transcript_18516/m.32363 type:complete len:236 (-) Transcript_18516:719-1426(-)
MGQNCCSSEEPPENDLIRFAHTRLLEKETWSNEAKKKVQGGTDSNRLIGGALMNYTAEMFQQSFFPQPQQRDDWKNIVRDEKPNLIFEDDSGFQLYIGAAKHATNIPLLEMLDIGRILNVSDTGGSADFYGDCYQYDNIIMEDREDFNISKHFYQTSAVISAAKQRKESILVHCTAGVSRSVTVVIAYLMRFEGLSLENAAAKVRSHRLQAFPNTGFVHQLLLFELESNLARTTI